MSPLASNDAWLNTLPSGDPETSSPHTSTTFRTDLEQKELDGARIHVYLMFYDEHALLWSSLEQQFYEFSEKRLNSALAYLEEVDAITIEPAPPPNPWSPEDALVSIQHSHHSLYTNPLPLPWPGSHIESPIVPATPAPLPFGFPVAVSEAEYADEIGRDQWTGGKTPFERMAMESGGMSSHGHGHKKSGSTSIRGQSTPGTTEGEYFPPMSHITPSTSQHNHPSSSHSDLPPNGHLMGSTTPRARRISTFSPLHSIQPSTATPHMTHTPSFVSMSIPRTHSLYSLDQIGFTGGHRGRMSGVIPATSTPPSSDWPSVAPTPVFGPTKGVEADANDFDLDLAEGMDGDAEKGSRVASNTLVNSVGLGHALLEKSQSEPGRGRSAMRDVGTTSSTLWTNGTSMRESVSPASTIERPSSVSSNSKKELRFDLPEKLSGGSEAESNETIAGRSHDTISSVQNGTGGGHAEKPKGGGKGIGMGMGMTFLPLL